LHDGPLLSGKIDFTETIVFKPNEPISVYPVSVNRAFMDNDGLIDGLVEEPFSTIECNKQATVVVNRLALEISYGLSFYE
jgi:hypothetical protein